MQPGRDGGLPRTLRAPRYADNRASWSASAASSGLPRVRSATAHSRSRWRATRSRTRWDLPRRGERAGRHRSPCPRSSGGGYRRTRRGSSGRTPNATVRSRRSRARSRRWTSWQRGDPHQPVTRGHRLGEAQCQTPRAAFSTGDDRQVVGLCRPLVPRSDLDVCARRRHQQAGSVDFSTDRDRSADRRLSSASRSARCLGRCRCSRRSTDRRRRPARLHLGPLRRCPQGRSS